MFPVTDRDQIRIQTTQRRELTVDDVAGMIEHRLHGPQITERALAEGCKYAVQAGLAAVLCRPEQVPEAVRFTSGAVKVVTALGYHDPAVPLLRPADLVAQANRLAEQGADEVSILGAPGSVPEASIDLLADQVGCVHGEVGPDVGVRVLLDCDGLDDDEVARACRSVAKSGASVVHAGSIRGDRTSFTRLEGMRSALPDGVLLKWTQPVKSLAALLVCVGLGVDRFNGDPSQLIISAKRAGGLGPITVPLAGLDF